ncbi:DUF5753 domain-containing protein [Nocardiopsis ganjiahuensis]|uniref:DUF5753 domain-containing protein n=1 Tax=Nocardiopsis ganjiahuensis TaxID=239984 RepID=UPI001EFA0152|nr:DUF5753 domain-containing protein [Nocardiopsis ganjiahuensis]
MRLGMLADITLTTPELLQEVEAGDLDPGRRLAQDLDRTLSCGGRLWDAWARTHLTELLQRPATITDVLPETFQVRAYAPLVLPAPYRTSSYQAALDQVEHPMDSARLDSDSPHLPRLNTAGTGGAPFHCLVVNETALTRSSTEPEVMRAQLVHLHHLAQTVGISVHLIPTSTAFHPGLGGAFWTLSYSPSHTLAYVPHPRGQGQIINCVSQVKSYTDLFATLQGAALPVEESQQRLVELASRIRSTLTRALAK